MRKSTLFILFVLISMNLTAQITLKEVLNDGDINNDLLVELTEARQIELTSDGSLAYILIKDGLSIFRVEPTSEELTFLKFISDTVSFLGGTNVFEDAKAIALSPDDKNLYIISNLHKRVAWFDLEANGDLMLAGSISEQDGVDGLEDLRDLLISPDGQFVYTLTEGSSSFQTTRGAITQFNRSTETGLLTYDTVYKDNNFLGALYAGNRLFISPDGLNIYVSNIPLAIESDNGSTDYLIFSREVVTGDLTLVNQASSRIVDLIFASDTKVFYSDQSAIYQATRELNGGAFVDIRPLTPFGFNYNSVYNLAIDTTSKTLYASRYFQTQSSVLVFDITGDSAAFQNDISNAPGWDITTADNGFMYQTSFQDNRISIYKQVIIVPEDLGINDVTAKTITFSWRPIQNALGYHVQLTNTTTGEFVVLAEDSTTNSSFTFTGLDPETLYRIRVRAYDENMITDFSPAQLEKTMILPLTSPVLSEATNVGSGSFSISWSEVEGTDEYHIFISNDNFESTGIERLTAIVNTQLTVSSFNLSELIPLSPNTTYQCRVKAVRTGANSSSSEFSNVIQVTTLDANLVLNQPIGITSNSFFISWEAFPGATRYTPLLSRDNFATTIQPFNGVTQVSETSFTYNGLDPNTDYQVRLEAFNDEILLKVSNTISVTTNSPVPQNPLILNEASNISATAFLASWEQHDEADEYRLFLSTDNFESLISPYDGTTSTSATQIDVVGLTPETSYSYQVKAYAQEELILTSDTKTVTTLEGGLIEQILSTHINNNKQINVRFDRYRGRLTISKHLDTSRLGIIKLLAIDFSGKVFADIDINLDQAPFELYLNSFESSLLLLRLVDAQGKHVYSGKYVVYP